MMFVYIRVKNSGDWVDLMAGLVIGAGLLFCGTMMAIGIVASAFR